MHNLLKSIVKFTSCALRPIQTTVLMKRDI